MTLSFEARSTNMCWSAVIIAACVLVAHTNAGVDDGKERFQLKFGESELAHRIPSNRRLRSTTLPSRHQMCVGEPAQGHGGRFL